ncbi:PREDICTED: P-selectin glycoprotein ligand 1 [Cyprinodon variegatus]|uniref:P-selectin glycoprotein ligand 1 n=1 Tax=Cyprinodon variegatus TaxID=28743 RepID=UPI0007425D4B|nr:PREDICTED: P-selectin glycoprotein ligand 1 [Cyprinodon variegatus]
MKPSSMICTLLLWGVCVCVLLAEEPVTSSAPDNSNTNITAPTDVTTTQQVTAHKSVLKPATLHPTKPADITAGQKVLPTTVPEDGIRKKSNSSAGGWLELTTAEPATSSFRLLTPTEKVTAKEVFPVKTTTATEQTLPAGFMTTDRPQSVRPTITATVTTASRGAASSSTPTAASTEQFFSSKTTVDVQTSSQITSTGSGLQQSTALSTATSEAQPSNLTTMTDAINQTIEHPYTSTFTDVAASTASHVPTQHSTSITGSKTEVPFTTSLGTSTQSTEVPTSGTFRSTGTELSSPSYPVPATTTFNSTPTGPVSTSTDSSNTTTANFSSPAWVFNPRNRESTTTWAPSTTKSPCEASKGSSSSEVLPCSTRGVVKQCLVIIAVLALVATIFIVSTIILCVKLSARKYKVRKPQQATEMTCISSLLPDRSITYTRQRNPVSNGVLVFPGVGDSDEEGGDNLTLSSFLPENDRYV